MKKSRFTDSQIVAVLKEGDTATEDALPPWNCVRRIPG